MSREFSTQCLSALACGLMMVVAACSGTSDKQDGEQAASNGVRLSPNPAYAASRIDVTFDDRWIDPATCRFVWKRNGAVIEEARAKALDSSNFSKGDIIAVEVLVEDSTGATPRKLSATVEVVNTPPKISGVTVVMTTATGKPEVQAVVQCTDPDGDGVTYRYRWFKNDGPLIGEDGPSLRPAELSRSDRVTVEVVADDGDSESPPVRSDVLQIENHPPQFSSQPVAPQPSDTTFRYQVTVVDPDRDPLSLELVSAPAGMTMGADGAVVWRLPSQKERQGEHRVSIKATDSKGGEAVQDFSLRFDSSKAAAKTKP
jgi:hypothetical protein